MNDIKRITLILLTCCIYQISNAKLIDNYGLRVGIGLSNQYWNYENDMFSELSDWKQIKPGLTAYINVEKILNKYISLRPEFGYIQKGFSDDITFTTSTGESVGTDKPFVVLHNLSINLAVKFKPFESKVYPYIIAGLRGDFLAGYKDYEIEFQGEKYGLYEDILNDYNKFVLGGLLGIGLDIQDLVYIDIEYNPAITKILDNSGFSIRDRYFGLTVGLNINALTKKNK